MHFNCYFRNNLHSFILNFYNVCVTELLLDKLLTIKVLYSTYITTVALSSIDYSIRVHFWHLRVTGIQYSTLTITTKISLYSMCPNRHFHTLPSLLISQAALPNSYPSVCLPNILGDKSLEY